MASGNDIGSIEEQNGDNYAVHACRAALALSAAMWLGGLEEPLHPRKVVDCYTRYVISTFERWNDIGRNSFAEVGPGGGIIK